MGAIPYSANGCSGSQRSEQKKKKRAPRILTWSPATYDTTSEEQYVRIETEVRSWIRGFKKVVVAKHLSGHFPCTDKFFYKSAGSRYNYAQAGSQCELAASLSLPLALLLFLWWILEYRIDTVRLP